jgi:hypothetical protein
MNDSYMSMDIVFYEYKTFRRIYRLSKNNHFKYCRQQELQEKLSKYLTEQKYQNSNVLIQTEETTTEISIKTKVENDEKVNELSNQIEEQLLAGAYIANTDEIVSQSIT